MESQGNPVHSAEIYGKLCNLYGDRFCVPMTLTFIVGKKKLSMADRVGAGDSADTVDVSAEAGSISATENTETTELNGDGANTSQSFPYRKSNSSEGSK